MMMCLASADIDAAREARASMADFVKHPPPIPSSISDLHNRTRSPTNQQVLHQAGLAIADALMSYTQGDYADTVQRLKESLPHWQSVGGSHAQRDILMLTMIEAAVHVDLALARTLLAERAALKDPGNEEKIWDRLAWVEDRIKEQAVGTCTTTS